MTDKAYDVFEELRQYDLSRAKMADTRRFSFSVPADFTNNPNFDPLYDGCGQCGECPDCLDGATTFTLEGYAETYLREYEGEYTDYLAGIDRRSSRSSRSSCIEHILRPGTDDPITKFISKGADIKQFKIPSTKIKDARCVWLDAGLEDKASFNDIEDKLLIWTTKFAESDVNEDGNIIRITWITESGCKCVSSWYNFIRWILCACLSDAAPK